MQRTVYHLLTETEPFSEYDGGAISRWAANVLRGDQRAIILCPVADDSWGYPRERIRTLPLLHKYRLVSRMTKRLPWAAQKTIFQNMLRSGLKSLQPGDIVWVHNRPDFAAAISPIIHAAGAKMVVHLHNSHLVHASDQITEEMNADHFIFVSDFLQGEAQDKFKEMTNCSVIYNGADQTLFYPRDDNGSGPARTPKVLFASRLVPQKGAHIFLDAMRQLQSKGVAVQGVIVGASHFGASKPTKYMLQLRTGAPENVSFLDYCAGKEVADLFRQADIFCLPSTWQDPFPLAPLEAMACRLPVVATRSGGIPEAFREGGAILISRGSVSELADALERLSLEPKLRLQLGEAGMASFQRNFTWGAVQQRYQTVLQGV